MNFFKRLTAFLLAMLLVTTMMGDDFFSFAEDPAVVTESSGGEAAAAPASEGGGDFVDVSTPVAEATPEAAPVAEEAAPAVTGSVETQATLEEAAPAENPAEITPETDKTEGATPALDENGNPISSEDIDNPEETKDPTTEDAEEDKDKEDKDKEDEDKDKEDEDKDKAEDKDCEHAEWSYSSNGDGTHKKICAECGEEQVEACTFNEDGVCIHCGYEKPKEEEECEHEWEYVSNGNGTHKKICKKCGEMAGEESCTYDEDLVCIHCGYQDECEHEEWEYVSNEDGTHKKICKRCHIEEVEECTFGEDRKCTLCGYEKECEHEEWEYTSNEDGTHTKRCKECGYEEIENCEFDENWVCKHCGYEDMTLVYQEYSKTIHGVKVTVAGEMPRKSNVTIYTRSLGNISNIINDNTNNEGIFEAYEAFDINIYDRHGDKYQPQDDGNTVKVTFEGVTELVDTPDEEIVAYRIEDDESTVTEIPKDVAGEDVSFDAEHFSIYVVGTVNSNLYASYQSYQNFATIITAPTTSTYTRVKKVKFDMYVDSIEEFNFTATVYKDLTNSTNPTSGTVVATKSEKEAPTSTGWMTVEITLPTSSTGYIQAGEKFSIVVSSTNDLVNIGYGTQKDSTYSSPTYVKGTSSWSRRSAEDEIFYIVAGDTIELTNVTEDTYTIDSITATTGKADNQKIYHYAVGDTDTLSAIIKDIDGNTVSRTVSWTPGDSSIVTVDSTGKLTAVSTGTTTVSASYTNSSTTDTETITVNIIDVSLDVTTYTYTGKEIEPPVTVNGGDSSASVTTDYSNNKDASTSTSKGQAVTSYTINGETYEFTNEFTINPAELTLAAFASADLVVTDGEVSSITGTTAIVASGVAPEFNKDFIATISSPSTTSSGITYDVLITGQGNYTGSFTWTKTLTGVDVKTILTAKLTSKGNNLKDTYYTGTAKSLSTETDSVVWQEVAFYDTDGVKNDTIINESTATYVITDKGSTESSPITAGTKTITFTMNANSGYTGSISVDFTIQKASMANTTIKWKHGGIDNNYSFDHTGSAIEPVAGTDFDVYIGDVLLTAPDENNNSDAEYKVSYVGDHTAVTDTPYLRVTGAGINFDSATYQQSSYVIKPCYSNDLIVRITDGTNYDGTVSNGYKTGYSTYYNPSETSKYFAPTDANYDENENSPNIKVVLPGVTLTEGTDYKVEVFNDSACTQILTKDVTSGTTKYIKVTGLGTYANETPVIATYVVDKLPMSNVNVTVKSGITKTFTGKPIELTPATSTTTSNADITVKYGSTILTCGTDYEIKYSDNTDAGTATFTLEGMNNYTGELSSSSKYKFTINKASIAAGNSDGVSVGLVTEQIFKYDGKVKQPAVKVTITTNGIKTFEESIDPTTNTSLATDNFTVIYENSPSPGTHVITLNATSTGNLKDSVTIPFTIASNTSGYDIWVTGDNGQNQAQRLSSLDKTTEETAEDGSTHTVYTRYYYLDSNFKTYYTGSKVACAFSVYDSEGNLLEKNADYSSFYSGINKYIQSGEYTATTGSPYLQITGLGNYEYNNAIVFFNIQPREITEDMVTGINASYDFSSSEVKPAPVVTYKSVLTVGTDYTVDWCDSYTYDENTATYSKAEDGDITATAGTKYVIINGTGNFTGSILIPYVVGADISTANVRIVSPYYESTTSSEDIFVPSSGSGIAAPNTSSESNPFSASWRNNEAPEVILYTSSGTKIDNTNGDCYEVSVKSSLLGDNPTSYPARNTTAIDDTNYNLITYTVTAKETGGYYGSTVIYYVIKPQNISTSDSRMSISTYQSQEYTGAPLTVDPNFIFQYGGSNDKYTLVGNTDFTPSPVSIGTDVSENNISATVSGIGNFTGEQALTFKIDPGYTNVYVNSKTADNLLGTTSAETNQYTITDAQEVYTYTGSEIKPTIIITDKSGNVLIDTSNPTEQSFKENTDYTIEYNNNVNATTSELASAVIKITNSNFASQTITVNYKIATNSIDKFTGSLSDITYTAIEDGYTPAVIDDYITKGTATLEIKSGTKVLERGTDYQVVTVKATIADIQKQTEYASVTSIQGQNTIPSYGSVNWIFVQGIGEYSGYLQIPFNIVLDLSSTTYAQVTVAKPYYELQEGGEPTEPIAPIIKYRAIGGAAGTFTETLDNSFTLNGNTVYNYSVSRDRDKLPGPDDSIRFTGNYACVNTTPVVRYNDGTTAGAIVYFLADLGYYDTTDISMEGGTIYPYTGSAITVSFNSDIIDEATYTADETSTAGDYTIIYTQNVSNLTNTPAIDVGKWYAVIKATDDSKYFKNNSSTLDTFSFNIKYNLADATIKFYDEANNEITSTSYTGTAYSILENTVVTIAGKVIYDYPGVTDYVSLTPESVTKIKDYTITAKPASGASDEVYGSKTTTFSVTGISLSTYATFSLEGTSFTYIGSGIEPKVTGTVSVGTTTQTLTEGKDFSVKYYENTNVGDLTAYVGITGLGSYACSEFYPSNLKFSITKLDLSDSHVQVQVDDTTYAGYYIDPSASEKKQVELTPSYSVYYIDDAKGIRNKLQEQISTTTTGDWQYGSFEHNTIAAASTDTLAPRLTVKAGDSGNTTGTATGTFTINKLNLNDGSVSVAQKTAEYTGSEIDVSDVVKLTTSYTNSAGETVTVPLTQMGAYEGVGDTICDYTVTVTKGNTNYTNGKITDVGTYSITITGVNSCTSSITESFTITERSLKSNYHYYYDLDSSSYVPAAWSSLYDSTNKKYVTQDPSGTGLKITIADVETVNGTDNPTNKPDLLIVDMGIADASTTTGYKHLEEGVDYTVSLSNNTAAGSASWNKDGSSTTNATVASTSPAITITGMGMYTDSITLPYNIGKNINTLGLDITYTMSGANLSTYTYNSAKANEVAWSYEYNGVQQVPSITVYNGNTKLTKNKAYTISYTDADGDEDTSINAGYKYVVITGIGDYCGTISQKYAINRKAIQATALKTNTESIVTGNEFTTENPMYATSDGTSAGTKVLTFGIADSSVTRLTATTAQTYLVDTGLMNETDAAKFVGYYYGVYAGSAIEPTVKVTDNTLGTLGTTSGVIGSEDLVIGHGTDGQSSRVSTFVQTDGTVTSYTCSEITVGFRASSADDFTPDKTGKVGNYYVPAGGTSTFHIQYLIVSHDISSDFEVQFVNGLDGNKYNYDDGKAITPEIKVTNGTLTLTEDEDYTVSYLDDSGNATNILPGVATITVTGIGNYRGTKQLNFYIYGDLADTDTYYYDSDGNFIEGIPTQQYTGVAITKGDPQIYLVLPHQNDQTEDYVLTYGTHYQVGKSGTSTDSFVTDGTVYYEGLSTGYWSGSKDLSYDIEFEESEVRATNYESSYEFTGYDIEPDFGLNISTATMGTITYSRDNVTTTDLTSIGTITASIPYSIGTYSGTVTAEYEITARDLSKNDEDSDDRVVVTLAHEYPRYTGRVVEPPFTIYILSKNLKTGATQVYSDLTEYDATDNQSGDYEVDYGNYIYGDGKLTITGKSERLIGEMSKAYTIKLQSVANLRVTENTGDTITVEWVRDMFSNGTKLTLLKLNSTGEYTEVLETAISDNTYTFTGLTSSTTYKIVATAVANTAGGVIQSDPKEVIETTGIAAGKVKVVSKTTGKATVSWGTDGNVLIYYVYRAEDETSEGKLLAILPASTGKYTNSKLTSGKTYYYHIDGYTLVDGVLTKVNESEHVAVTIK